MSMKKPFIIILFFILLEFSGSVAAARRIAVSVPLTPEEAKTLLFMREEEKLARDVYLTMYELYKPNDGSIIFKDIASSEQSHMDALKKLLDKYLLDDPAQNNIGKFTDPNLQDLYDELLARGQQSFLEALGVGVLIEEKDMVDIEVAIDKAEHTDLVKVYGNLLDGSKNHLRAFMSQIETLDSEYRAILH